MKAETYEIVIEELTKALEIERWRLKDATEKNAELKRQIHELKEGGAKNG